MAWSSILAGEDRRRALDLASRLLGNLATNALDETHDLANGAAGMSLVLAYSSECGISSNVDAQDVLASALEVVATHDVPGGLFNGFGGVAWMLEFLNQEPEHQPNAQTIDRLRACVELEERFDLFTGLTGLLLLAVDLVAYPGATEVLKRGIERLADLAEPTARGVLWRLPLHSLTPRLRSEFPFSYCCTGLAHGSAGTISVLSRIVEIPQFKPLAEPLLRKAIEGLLELAVEGERSRFPVRVSATSRRYGSLAWCQSDLGIALCLLHAARALEDADLLREAITTAHYAGRSNHEIMDDCFCHGRVGIAHQYNRLWQATGDIAMQAEALHWYRLVLQQSEFLFYRPLKPNEPRWIADDTFLTGTAGIAAGLLAASSDVAPLWDRVLCCSTIEAC